MKVYGYLVLDFQSEESARVEFRESPTRQVVDKVKVNNEYYKQLKCTYSSTRVV